MMVLMHYSAIGMQCDLSSEVQKISPGDSHLWQCLGSFTLLLQVLVEGNRSEVLSVLLRHRQNQAESSPENSVKELVSSPK